MHTLNQSRSVQQAIELAPVQHYEPVEEPSSKLLEYGKAVLRGWPLVLLVTLSTIVLALLIRTALPLKYSSRVVLEVRSPNERFLNREAFDPRSMNSAIGAESYLQTQLQILDSDVLFRSVLDRMTRQPGLTQAVLASRLGVAESELAPPQTKVSELLRKIVHAKVIPQTRLIEVVATTSEARFSAQLANTIAAQFIEEESSAQHAAMDDTRKMLTSEMDGLKTRLVQSQNELNGFLRSTGLLMNGRNENVLEGQLTKTQGELAAAQAERIKAQSQYEQIAQSDAESLPDVLNDVTLKDYRNSLAALQRELADLSTTLAPKHYKIQKVKAQIEQLEKERAAFQRRIVNKIRNDYESAARRERLLDSVYKRSAATLTDQNAKGLRYTQLKGEMEANRHIYESMLARLKETEVISAIGATNIRVVDPAWPAAKSKFPNLWQSGVAGLLSGLALGALAAIGRQSWSKTFREPSEISAYLRVPRMNIGRTGRAPLRGGMADLTAWSPAALESYAAVIASIETSEHPDLRPGPSGLEWAARAAGRCLVVSSPCAGDGKTVTTVGLGTAVARSGKRVLLVNGDMLKPQLHAVVGGSNDEGLADLLAEGDLTRLTQLIEATPVRGLSVLPGGPPVGETIQLFDSPLLPHLLDKLRDHFDLVLIDTPPLLGVADARLLARFADGVILVVRAGQTERADAAAARQRLANFGLKLSAVILNDTTGGRAAASAYRKTGAGSTLIRSSV